MKKFVCFLVVGAVCVSGALFAQSFTGGGFTGPSIEPITVADLAETAANEYVFVTGTLTKMTVPGRFVLSEPAEDDAEPVSIIVRIDSYAWSNIEVDDTTPVVIYGIVLKKFQTTEILAERIDLYEQE